MNALHTDLAAADSQGHQERRDEPVSRLLGSVPLPTTITMGVPIGDTHLVVPIGDTCLGRWVSRRTFAGHYGRTPRVLLREAADDVAASSGASAHNVVVHMSTSAPPMGVAGVHGALRGRSGCPLFAALSVEYLE